MKVIHVSKIISYTNQKGGVGKSTICIQSAFDRAEKGFKTLVIDLDPQGNTSSRLSGGNELTGTKAAQLFLSDLDTIEPMSCKDNSKVPQYCRDNIDIIHTPKNDAELAKIESQPLTISANPRKNLQETLQKYDYVLIDCPPALGNKLVAALMLSTHVACPVKLSGFAVDGIEGLLRTIIGVRDRDNSALQIAGIIINDMDNSVVQRKALESLQKAVPHLLLENRIMHRPPLDAATSLGVPVKTLTYGHVAAKEVDLVLTELFEERVTG